MGNRATTMRLLLLTATATLIVAGCSHEAADWKSATLANSTEAYQSFLQRYPHSREATEAQARIKQLTEERDWQNAIAANTREGYQQFTTQHPDSKYADEAKLRMENFAQADVGTAGAAGAGMSTAAGTGPSATESPNTASAAGALSAPAPSTQSAAAAPGVAAAAPMVAEAPRVPSHAHTRGKASHLASAKHAGRESRAHSGASSQWVQLGAFGSRSRAESRWRQLSARFSALKSLHPRYVAIRSHQHHLYRLEVRLSSAAAASGLCARLKRHAQACMRVNA